MAGDVLDGGRILLSRCSGCGEIRFPVQRHCACGGRPQRLAADGGGSVLAACAIRKGSKAFPVPYQVVLVRLAEGPYVYGKSLGDADLKPGDDVTVSPVAVGERTAVGFRKSR